LCHQLCELFQGFALVSRTQAVVALRARIRSIQRKCWFFYRAVVIRMQCSRSPRALHDIATHSRLGGQHGEEAKDEDEVSGEEGRAQDEGAPEEEVKYSPLPVFDLEQRR
jgi:hypothetical protein